MVRITAKTDTTCRRMSTDSTDGALKEKGAACEVQTVQPRKRFAAPFNLSTSLRRAARRMALTTMGYMLMLAVMSDSVVTNAKIQVYSLVCFQVLQRRIYCGDYFGIDRRRNSLWAVRITGSLGKPSQLSGLRTCNCNIVILTSDNCYGV